MLLNIYLGTPHSFNVYYNAATSLENPVYPATISARVELDNRITGKEVFPG